VRFIRLAEKELFTIASPSNTQNDRLRVAVATRKRDFATDRHLRTRPTSLMASVGVYSLGRTSIDFVEQGVKVNGQY